MKQEEKALIQICSSIVLRKTLLLPECDLNKLFRLSKNHSLLAFIDDKVQSSNIDSGWKEQSKKYRQAARFKEVKQEYYLEIILSELRKNHIEHVLYKGTRLKKYYDESSVRIMGDIDLFIREENITQIEKMMKELNFKKNETSESHLVYRPEPLVMIEFHPKLFDEIYFENHFFEDYFQHTRSLQPYTYEFIPEYHLIYLIAHFAKHMRGGGAGYRNIVDFAYFMRGNPALNYELIEEELKKIQLDRFFQRLKGIIQEDYHLNLNSTIEEDVYDLMHRFIFESGTYGFLDEKRKVENQISSLYRSRLHFLMRKAFPNLKSMRSSYKILNHLPVLLPVCWGIRFFRMMILHFGKTLRKLKSYRMNKKNIERAKKEYQKIGL